MVKHAGIQHHVADAYGVRRVAGDALVHQLLDRLAADEALRVRLRWDAIFAIADVEDAPHAGSQFFEFAAVERGRGVFELFICHDNIPPFSFTLIQFAH